MTREPFIAHSELTNEIYIVTNKEKYRVTEQAIKAVKAIKALEQELCEDAISRQTVQDYIAKYLSQYLYEDVREAVEVIDEYIGELPSVKPQEPFNIDTYCKEHFCVMVDKDVWDKAEKALDLPWEDAISRQALLEEIENGIKAGNYEEGYEEYPHINDMDDIIECIKYADSIQPKPKTGHWILADEQNKEDVENDNYRFICSECQCSDIHAKGTIVPYCWKCGARMESEV